MTVGRALLGLASALAISGMANAGEMKQPVSYCELIANAPQLDGKAVVVRATLKFSQDGFAIFSHDCRSTRPALVMLVPAASQDANAVSAYRRLTESNAYAEVDAVVEGRFRQAKMYECIAIYGGCYSYALEDVVLKSVREFRR